MPNWKKVITSGSNAELNKLVVDTQVSASLFSGSFYGDGSGLTGIAGGGSSVWYDGTTYITSSADVQITGSLQIYKSGSTVFNIEGSQGTLFTVTDELSGSLFSVNDISGLPIFEVFSDDTIIAGAYNQNDFVIKDSNVGIGTSSPVVKLNVEYDDNEFAGGLLIKNINTGGSAFSALSLLAADYTNGFSLSQGNGDGNIRMYNGDNTDMVFYTNATERIRIQNTGEIKIPGSLSVGSISPSATVGRIDASNDIVAYSSSDKRWKTNIKLIESPLEKLQKLSGVEFDWIEDFRAHGNSGNDIGVIAQEVELVLPQVVQTRDSGMKAVRYEKLIPLLIETIKEQQKQIDELKNKIG